MKLPNKIAVLFTTILVSMQFITDASHGLNSKDLEDGLVGDSRYETVIKVSKAGWIKSGEALIVNESSIVDALAATPFAKIINAPILVTGKDNLDTRTKSELIRLGVSKVYLIGGKDILSNNVEAQLSKEGISVERIYGKDRYETSIKIADKINDSVDISEIVVVNGKQGLADAASISAVAGKRNIPILLVDPSKEIISLDELINSKSINNSFVIGGEDTLPNHIANKLPNNKRIGGKDRSETNAKIIETFYTDTELKNAYVVKNGMNNENQLIDALSVGVLAAKNDSPIILVGDTLSDSQIDVTNTKSFLNIVKVGGKGNESAYNQLKSIQSTNTFEAKDLNQLNTVIENADANDIINFTSSTKIDEDVIINTEKSLTINIKRDYRESFIISSPNSKINNLGIIDNIVVDNTNKSNIINNKNSKIYNLDIKSNAENVLITNKGTIEKIRNNTKGTKIDNTEGRIINKVLGTQDPIIIGNEPEENYSGGSNSNVSPVPPSTSNLTRAKNLINSIEENPIVVEKSVASSLTDILKIKSPELQSLDIDLSYKVISVWDDYEYKESIINDEKTIIDSNGKINYPTANKNVSVEIIISNNGKQEKTQKEFKILKINDDIIDAEAKIGSQYYSSLEEALLDETNLEEDIILQKSEVILNESTIPYNLIGSRNLIVSEGQILRINEGAILNLSDSSILKNMGKIIVNGDIINKDNVVNEGICSKEISNKIQFDNAIDNNIINEIIISKSFELEEPLIIFDGNRHTLARNIVIEGNNNTIKAYDSTNENSYESLLQINDILNTQYFIKINNLIIDTNNKADTGLLLFKVDNKVILNNITIKNSIDTGLYIDRSSDVVIDKYKGVCNTKQDIWLSAKDTYDTKLVAINVETGTHICRGMLSQYKNTYISINGRVFKPHEFHYIVP